MSIPNYLYALANHKGPATINAGGMSIPVKIGNLDHRSGYGQSDLCTFECLVVNDDQIRMDYTYGVPMSDYVARSLAKSMARNAKYPKTVNPFDIKRVIFSDPATIVIWADGTKTIVKCQVGDVYSKETGLALCIAKKALGNTGSFNDIFHKWIPEEEEVEFDISKIESPAQKAFDEAVAKINACMKSTINKTYRAHVGDAHE